MLLLLLLMVEHGRATGRRRPVLEAGLVAGPWQVEVAPAEVHAGATVVQLDAVRSEHPLVQEAGVVERRVRELRAQVQRRQAIGLAEIGLLHRRLPVLAAAAAGVRRLLAHAEVARVALQRRAR